MEILIETGIKGSRFEAVCIDQGYKLVKNNLTASHAEILNGEEEELIGWGLVPYYVYLHTIHSDLNKLRSELGGRWGGEDSLEPYFENYFNLSWNRIWCVHKSFSEGKPAPLEKFVRSHIAFEAQQSSYCINFLKEDYQGDFNKFFQFYKSFLNSKTPLFKEIIKHRVIGFYLVESGEDPTTLTRKELEARFQSAPLSFFFKGSSPENVQKEIRKDKFFQPGSSDYERAKKEYPEDYEFAKLLI